MSDDLLRRMGSVRMSKLVRCNLVVHESMILFGVINNMGSTSATVELRTNSGQELRLFLGAVLDVASLQSEYIIVNRNSVLLRAQPLRMAAVVESNRRYVLRSSRQAIHSIANG